MLLASFVKSNFGDHLADFGVIHLDTAHAGEELDELRAPNDLGSPRAMRSMHAAP
jgi:hypothetical protein